MKFKQRLMHVFAACVMVGLMWLVTLLPSDTLDIVALWVFGVVGVLLCCLLFLTLKRKSLFVFMVCVFFYESLYRTRNVCLRTSICSFCGGGTVMYLFHSCTTIRAGSVRLYSDI